MEVWSYRRHLRRRHHWFFHTRSSIFRLSVEEVVSVRGVEHYHHHRRRRRRHHRRRHHHRCCHNLTITYGLSCTRSTFG